MTYTAKFSGPTNYKGARIIVKDWNGKRSEHSWKYELAPSANYKRAMDERAERDLQDPCVFFAPIDGGYIWSNYNHLEFL